MVDQAWRYSKLIALLVVGVFGVYRLSREVVITTREPSPTPVSVDRWEGRPGCSWLEVEGRLAIERAITRKPLRKAEREKGAVYVYVPIVPQGTDATLVRAVAVIGPVPEDKVSRHLQARNGRTITRGLVAPGDVHNPARIMPGERVDPDAVFIYENREPLNALMAWFLLLFFLGMALVFGYPLMKDLQRWLEPRATIPASGQDRSIHANRLAA